MVATRSPLSTPEPYDFELSSEILNLLACPDCHHPLESLNSGECPECGLPWGRDDGTPMMMPSKTEAEVEFKFGLAEENGHVSLEEVLKDPPQIERNGDLPYHLDLCHAKVLEELPAGSRVLEIGCGGGQARAWFEERGQSYVGVDIAKDRVHEWLKDYGGPDLLCDAHFLPFRDQQFDVIYSAAVFEHILCPPVVIRELQRVLKPGGVFLGNCAFLEPWHDSSFFHMSPSGVFAMLSQAGYQIDYIWPGHGYSGYRAMCTMSSRVMSWLRPVGELAYGIYRLENFANAKLRQVMGKEPNASDIEKRGRVSGSINWIARASVAS